MTSSGHKNIYLHKCGWVVRIQRPGIKYRFYIPCGKDRQASLSLAIAERDRFLELHGRYGKPKSNTGVVGICNMTKWTRGRSYEVFSVVTKAPRHIRNFYYRGPEGRLRALRKAIAWRAQRCGEDLAFLTTQAKQNGVLDA
jgi:hypothetical protein